LTGSILDAGTLTGTVTVPGFGFGILSAYVPTFSGTINTVSYTEAGYSVTMIPTTTAVNLAIVGNVNEVEVMISLYVATRYFNGTATLWSIHDPLNEVADQVKDYLDLVSDLYLRPLGQSGFTGRSWRLRLPCPIILGPLQALVCTVSVGPFAGSQDFVAYIRSRVSVQA